MSGGDLRTRAFRLALCTLVFFSAVALHAASGGSDTESPPAGLFPEDRRLAKTVRVSRPRVYLGELLEQLSDQSGVRLQAEDGKGPLDGVPLTALLRDRPVREVMAALAELLTTPYHRFEWRESGRSYVLRHYPTFEEAASTARARLLADWDADVRFAYRLAGLPENARAPETAARPSLFGKAKPPHRYLRLLGKLTPSELDTVLRGTRVPLDPGKLGAADHEALKLGILGDAGGAVAKPVTPALYVAWDRREVGPVLWVRNHTGAAVSVVGGFAWDGRWLAGRETGWKGQTDPEAQELQQRRARNGGGVGTRVADATLPDWLKRAAGAHGVSILADPVLPRGGRNVSGAARLGVNAELTMLHIVLSAYASWKKKGEIHLLRDKTALVHPRDHLVPWKQIRGWRSVCTESEGYLRLESLAEMSELTSAQLEGLAEEFPDARANLVQQWRGILRFYSLLDRTARRKLLSESGLRYPDAGVVARAALTEANPAERPAPGPGEPPANAPRPPKRSDVRGLPLLAEFSNKAVLRLAFEKLRIPGRDGQSERYMIKWTVTVPGERRHEARQFLTPRRPLQPE